MLKRKLTFQFLVTTFLLFFTTVEVLPVVMSCVMGSTCGMMTKSKACHKSNNDLSISAASCCKMMVSTQSKTEKEIIPAFTYQIVLADECFDGTVSFERSFDDSFLIGQPNHYGPPLYILKQSFLI